MVLRSLLEPRSLIFKYLPLKFSFKSRKKILDSTYAVTRICQVVCVKVSILKEGVQQLLRLSKPTTTGVSRCTSECKPTVR